MPGERSSSYFSDCMQKCSHLLIGTIDYLPGASYNVCACMCLYVFVYVNVCLREGHGQPTVKEKHEASSISMEPEIEPDWLSIA
jgi:hypothetical protein